MYLALKTFQSDGANPLNIGKTLGSGPVTFCYPVPITFQDLN
jgi:hypothetical protein